MDSLCDGFFALKRKVVQRPKVKDTWQVFFYRIFWRIQVLSLSRFPLGIDFERKFGNKWTKQFSVPFRVLNKKRDDIKSKQVYQWLENFYSCFLNTQKTIFHNFVSFSLLYSSTQFNGLSSFFKYSFILLSWRNTQSRHSLFFVFIDFVKF